MSELDALVDQLDELLGEGAVDPDDALEIATVAGLVARLGGPDHPSLAAARAWRDTGGAELLAAAFDELDLEELLGNLDAQLDGNATDEAVEEAVFDLDDVIAAAIWSGHRKAVKAAAEAVAQTIRDIPEPFVPLAEFGRELARSPAVAQDLDLYEYWLAIADAPAAAGVQPEDR